MEVELLHWPAEADRREDLRRRAVPRLLVVADGAEWPAPADCLEEAVAGGAGDAELAARRQALEVRAAQHAPRPTLDGDGLLRHRDRWVSLSPVEQSLTGALLDRFGAVVTRDGLAERAWPRGMPTRNALDVHVLRLRRRIAPLELEIRTVRSRGYLLQAASDPRRHTAAGLSS